MKRGIIIESEPEQDQSSDILGYIRNITEDFIAVLIILVLFGFLIQLVVH